MYKQDVLGELLYIGFVAEKGRCYGKRWNLKYRRILRCHIEVLSKLLDTMIQDQTDISYMMEEFVGTCDNNAEIGKFYRISDKVRNQLDNRKINWERKEHNYAKVNELMVLLMEELLTEVNKFIIKNRNIYYLLNILHNLPRVYLGEEKDTICGLRQGSIPEEDALQYAFQVMNYKDKNKFEILLGKE